MRVHFFLQSPQESVETRTQGMRGKREKRREGKRKGKKEKGRKEETNPNEEDVGREERRRKG